VICQIRGCLDPEHQSLAMLEEHVNKLHLNTIPISCPALGMFYFIMVVSLSYA